MGRGLQRVRDGEKREVVWREDSEVYSIALLSSFCRSLTASYTLLFREALGDLIPFRDFGSQSQK